MLIQGTPMTPFQKYARDPRYWYEKAVGLHKSAKVLQREIEADLARLVSSRHPHGTVLRADDIPGFQLASGASLLEAFAIENLLKGIIVVREPTLVQEQKLDKALSPHRLLPLARRAGFEFGPLDAYFLEAASEYGTWAGKYHTPKNRGPGRIFTSVFSAGDFVAFDQLYSRFEAELRKSVPDRIVYQAIGGPPRT
jgi:hypothetical protein